MNLFCSVTILKVVKIIDDSWFLSALRYISHAWKIVTENVKMATIRISILSMLVKVMIINGDDDEYPKIMVSMFVSNKSLFINNVLKFLEDQEYPKSRIGLLIRCDFNDGKVLNNSSKFYQCKFTYLLIFLQTILQVCFKIGVKIKMTSTFSKILLLDTIQECKKMCKFTEVYPFLNLYNQQRLSTMLKVWTHHKVQRDFNEYCKKIIN